MNYADVMEFEPTWNKNFCLQIREEGALEMAVVLVYQNLCKHEDLIYHLQHPH